MSWKDLENRYVMDGFRKHVCHGNILRRWSWIKWLGKIWLRAHYFMGLQGEEEGGGRGEEEEEDKEEEEEVNKLAILSLVE
jgi:hypothetical protein